MPQVSGISGNVTENHKVCGMMTLVAAKRLLVDDLISDYTTIIHDCHGQVGLHQPSNWGVDIPPSAGINSWWDDHDSDTTY